MQKNNFNAIR